VKYLVTISQDLGIDYCDEGPWRSYQLETYGNSLDECLKNAGIEEVDQDGGSLRFYDLEDGSNEVIEKATGIIRNAFLKGAA
jgi:hypothetical protein